MKIYDNIEEVKNAGQLIPNSLVNADCLEAMKYIKDKSIDLILCDLPYGTTQCKWDIVIPFDKLWEQYERIIKDNGAIVLFGAQPFTSKLICSNLKLFKYELIWQKERPTNPMLCQKRFPTYHENILVFYKNQPTFNPQTVKREEKNKRRNTPRVYEDRTKIKTDKYSERVLSGTNDYIYQPDILKVSMEREYHETQKPTKLLELLIKTYTDECKTVLDNCMGSGSTGVACVNTNRNFIGIELDKNYFNIAKERIEKEKQKHKQISFFD